MSVYKNGNTIVEIRDDGTKIRFVPDNVPAQPVYPESIDMKITNYCDMGCPMCHERSSVDGKHGNLSNKLIESLHPYTEVAIGGGNPLSHPALPEFLTYLKKRKVIANITVHWKEFLKNVDLLHNWTNEGMIHGLGISIDEIVPEEVIEKIKEFPYAVIHTIIGIANKSIIEQFVDKDLNILLLGYKFFGRGIDYKFNYDLRVSERMTWMKKNLKDYVKRFRAVSFDNLAIEQVKLKELLDPYTYTQMYMGGDGTFTMYVDLVENKYAVSSISIDRYDIDSNNIDDLFANIRSISNAACDN